MENNLRTSFIEEFEEYVNSQNLSDSEKNLIKENISQQVHFANHFITPDSYSIYEGMGTETGKKILEFRFHKNSDLFYSQTTVRFFLHSPNYYVFTKLSSLNKNRNYVPELCSINEFNFFDQTSMFFNDQESLALENSY